MESFLIDSLRQRAGFDFTGHVRQLAADMTGRLPELFHIDMDRVAIRFCQTRKGGRYGVHASLTPLRFQAALFGQRRGRTYAIERMFDAAGREMLYLLSFYLPRFLNGPVEEKLDTVIHELWHISPAFDGDLRRHPGRCYAHSHSQREYDALVSKLRDKWLSAQPPAALYEFLRYDFRQLSERHGGVYGVKTPTPKLRRVG